jgi:hypothetical protein
MRCSEETLVQQLDIANYDCSSRSKNCDTQTKYRSNFLASSPASGVINTFPLFRSNQLTTAPKRHPSFKAHQNPVKRRPHTHPYRKARYAASALIAFSCTCIAGSALFLDSTGLIYRFEGSNDLSSAFVDAIVDVDLVDTASFSDMVLIVVCFEVLIAEELRGLRVAS